MISREYLAQQIALHEKGTYGVSGARHVEAVRRLSESVRSYDILDYGCGKRLLEAGLGFAIRNYDPCIPGLDDAPEPADVVVCTDVLEHIEPEYLDDVLDDLKRVTKKVGLFVIATGPAVKVLPDGRNAHLIQEGQGFWVPKLMARFRIKQFKETKQELTFVVANAT